MKKMYVFIMVIIMVIFMTGCGGPLITKHSTVTYVEVNGHVYSQDELDEVNKKMNEKYGEGNW